MVFGLFSRKDPLVREGEAQDLTDSQTQSLFADSNKSRSESPTRPPDSSDSANTADTSDLYDLIRSVPSKTLHTYTLTHLGSDALSQATYNALWSFFSALTPPPVLHCVRCHKSFTDITNDDRSCRVAHDDDSAEVDYVGYSARSSSDYETTYGCCGRTVEGEGDMGPPDGWCYEGMHTTDFKRARFRADSTLHDDKLVPCSLVRCHEPSPSASPRSVRSGKSRNRSTSAVSRTYGSEGRSRKRSHATMKGVEGATFACGYESDTNTLTVAQPTTTKDFAAQVPAGHDESDDVHSRGRTAARGRRSAKDRPAKRARLEAEVVDQALASVDHMKVDEGPHTDPASEGESESGGPARRTRSRSRSRVRPKANNSLVAVAAAATVAAAQKRRSTRTPARNTPPKPASKAGSTASKPKSRVTRSATPASGVPLSRVSTPHELCPGLPDAQAKPLKRSVTHSRSKSSIAFVEIPLPLVRPRTKALREVVASSIEGEK